MEAPCDEGCFEARVVIGGKAIDYDGTAMFWDGEDGERKIQLTPVDKNAQSFLIEMDGHISWPEKQTAAGKLLITSKSENRMVGSIEARNSKSTVTAKFTAVRFK